MNQFQLNFDGTQNNRVVFREEEKNVQNAPPYFKGKYLETAECWNGQVLTVFIGKGKKPLDAFGYQELLATAVKIFKKREIYDFTVDLAGISLEQNILENAFLGLFLGAYEYKFKSKDFDWTIRLDSIEEKQQAQVQASFKKAKTIAEGITLARDLVNIPGNHMVPKTMAETIVKLLAPLGVECEILEHDTIKEKGLNGLCLIGESSANLPCLLVMRYASDSNKTKIGLVGKGVTFDTGGYNLKTGPGMIDMKSDMAGGAAVAGAIYSLAKNKEKANVVGVIPLCENRISDSSSVPGDVYTAYSGKTVEVLNTDAEGRIILADAVTYVQRDEKVEKIVDIATLTGAVVSALGTVVAGVVSNNKEWWGELEKAAAVYGERYLLWPDYPEYHKMLESDIADIKNLGGKYGGSITGGLFVGAFVEDIPWMHLDIAGTSWVETPDFAFQSKGGTGAGLTALYALSLYENE